MSDSLSVARMVNEYVVVDELPVSVPEIVPIDESPSKVNPPGKLPDCKL